MIPANIPGRVAILERQMHAIAARFDALSGQISQLREEMQVEFAAMRDQFQQADEAIRREVRDEVGTLRDEVRAVHAEALTAVVATRDLLLEQDERIYSQMRVLHEEVLDRLKRISRG